MRSKPIRVLLAVILSLGPASCGGDRGPPGARAEGLGSLRFPTSAAGEAQARFLRGLAALHSFWYEEAVASFQEAERLEPRFALAYYGEALAHDEVWMWMPAAEGRAILAKLAPTRETRLALAPTEREKAYAAAVEELFAEDDFVGRNRAFERAMEDLAERYPDDLEARALLAQALLRTLDVWAVRDTAVMLRAGAVAESVLARNPDHPGALHYLIHAYDTPEFASRALDAARRYGRVAPEAPHAVHMPSHIFLQLGLWDEAISANRAAWEVSTAWSGRTGRRLGGLDYHAIEFLYYALLQEGRYEEALDVWRSHIKEALEGEDEWPSWAGRWYYDRLAMLALEAERREVIPDPLPARAQEPPIWYALGALAARSGRVAEARGWHRRLVGVIENEEEGSVEWKRARIIALELEALIRSSGHEPDQAVAAAAEAADLMAQLGPQSELPDPIQPVHELYGQVLLAAARAAEAEEQYREALRLMPNRPAALLGAARAARAAGHGEAARRFYDRLLRTWAKADVGLAALEEARAAAGRVDAAGRVRADEASAAVPPGAGGRSG